MPDAVKDHPGKAVVGNQLIEQAADGRTFDGRPGGRREHHIVIRVFIPHAGNG